MSVNVVKNRIVFNRIQRNPHIRKIYRFINYKKFKIKNFHFATKQNESFSPDK